VDALLGLAGAPVDARHDHVPVDAVVVLDGDVHQRVQEAVAQVVRLQAEVKQLGVRGVVVVVVLLDARVLDVLQARLDAQLGRGVYDQLR
jgi:hypothetical protein